MEASHKITAKRVSTAPNTSKARWNINCDTETHEALDIIGEWMTSDTSIKDHVTVPKNKIIKILAKEKLDSLGLLSEMSKKSSEAAR